jgi:hypothetical protein
MLQNFIKILVSLWVGALWWMMLVAVVLFEKIPTNFLAGLVAAELFKYLSYVGFVVTVIFMLSNFNREGFSFIKKGIFWIVFVMLSILLINYFGIHPFLETMKVKAMPKEVMESIFADRFAAWHGVSSVAYLINAILGIFLIQKLR